MTRMCCVPCDRNTWRDILIGLYQVQQFVGSYVRRLWKLTNSFSISKQQYVNLIYQVNLHTVWVLISFFLLVERVKLIDPLPCLFASLNVTSFPVGGAGKEGCTVLIFDPNCVNFINVILLCRIDDILLFWLFAKMQRILLNIKEMFTVQMYCTYSFASRYSTWNKKQTSFDITYRIAVCCNLVQFWNVCYWHIVCVIVIVDWNIDSLIEGRRLSS